jgi:hypothetical protein
MEAALSSKTFAYNQKTRHDSPGNLSITHAHGIPKWKIWSEYLRQERSVDVGLLGSNAVWTQKFNIDTFTSVRTSYRKKEAVLLYRHIHRRENLRSQERSGSPVSTYSPWEPQIARKKRFSCIDIFTAARTSDRKKEAVLLYLHIHRRENLRSQERSGSPVSTYSPPWEPQISRKKRFSCYRFSTVSFQVNFQSRKCFCRNSCLVQCHCYSVVMK